MKFQKGGRRENQTGEEKIKSRKEMRKEKKF